MAGLIGFNENIYAVLEWQDGSGKIKVYKSHNIVTNAGDVYYAQRAASESVTNAFGIMELGTAGDAPAKASIRSNVTAVVAVSQKAHDGTYPLTNDPDPDNPDTVGTDVVTYRVSYTVAEANDTDIDRVIITNVTPAAGEALLSYGVFSAPFTKTGAQTLKVFVNHTFNGV